MTEDLSKGKPTNYRTMIDAFIAGRLQDKLEKLDDGDPKRDELQAKYERTTWLMAASLRAKSISIATHLVKPINPRARGTNIFWTREDQSQPNDVIGTHSIGSNIAIVPDVTGDAAAFDVYSLLCLSVAGKSLLQALVQGEEEALTSLDENPEAARSLAERFLQIAQPVAKDASSHLLAKQIYWLAKSDTCANSSYQLLAPLYSSPLANVLYHQIQEDKFGESRKEVRDAFRNGKEVDGIHHVYPGLAVQKLGGTKAQTVSRQNLSRRGMNYLLSSLPPTWKSAEFRPPAHTRSVFDRIFTNRLEVRRTAQRLRALLENDPAQTKETRNRVNTLVEQLIDEVIVMAGGFQHTLPRGWSCNEEYEDLAREEQLWLDPLRAELPDEGEFAREWLWMDWPAAIGKRFAQWLNGRLEGRLTLGDAAHRQWKKLLLVDESTDGWAQQLHRLRKSLDAATHIPTRKTHDELVEQGGNV